MLDIKEVIRRSLMLDLKGKWWLRLMIGSVPIFVAIIVLFFIHQLRTRKILEEDHDIDKSRFSVVQLYKSIFFCFRKKSPKKNIDRQDFEGSSLNDIIPDIYLPPIIFSSQDLNLFARTFHSDTNDTRYHTGVSVLSKT